VKDAVHQVDFLLLGHRVQEVSRRIRRWNGSLAGASSISRGGIVMYLVGVTSSNGHYLMFRSVQTGSRELPVPIHSRRGHEYTRLKIIYRWQANEPRQTDKLCISRRNFMENSWNVTKAMIKGCDFYEKVAKY